MYYASEITESEQRAVRRHLTDKSDNLSQDVLNKILLKYEYTLTNLKKEVCELKMELDDKDIAFSLYLENKLPLSKIKKSNSRD